MATYYSNTSVVYRLRLDLTEQSQSQVNNTTTLAYALKWEKTNSAYGAYRDADCDQFTLVINGTTLYSAKPAWDLRSVSSITIASGTTTIEHDSDGTKTVSFSFGFEPLSRLNNYYPGAVSGSGSLTLTKIIRASVPTLTPASIICDGTNSFTITTNRALTSYTHTLTYAFGNASGTIATGVGASTAWTPPVTLLQQIPNSSSGTGTITTTTYDGETVIGTSTVSFTLSTVTACSMSAATVTETACSKVTGADTVRYLSRKTISVTASLYQGATVASVTVTCGSLTKALSGSGTSWSYAGLAGMTAASYTITLTDSRGLQSTITRSGTYYPYTYPTITSLTIARDTATSATGPLEAEGDYYNALSNTVTAAVSGDQTLTPTVTAASGDWAIDEAMTGLDYDQSFDFTLTITDGFGQSVSKNVSLAVSRWTMWMGKDTVRIRDNLQVEETVRIGSGSNYVDLDSSLSAVAEMIYPVGSVYMTTSSADLSSWLGLSWELQSQGKYIMTAGSSYSGGSSGGHLAYPSVNEASGYGLASSGGFTDRAMIMGTAYTDTADYRPPYLAVYVWVRVSGTPAVTRSITNSLTNVSNSNAAASVNDGASYTATLTPDSGYLIDSVTVTMGGVDITNDVFTGTE